MDMLLSRRKITVAMIESILPLADLAAVAIHKDWMLEQKESTSRQQERIMEIAAAIAGPRRDRCGLCEWCVMRFWKRRHSIGSVCGW